MDDNTVANVDRRRFDDFQRLQVQITTSRNIPILLPSPSRLSILVGLPKEFVGVQLGVHLVINLTTVILDLKLIFKCQNLV